MAAVGGLKQHIGRVIHGVRIERREHHRLRAVSPVFAIAQGNGSNVLHLPGAPMEARHLGTAGAVNDVRIEGVGGSVAVLDDADRAPVAEGDFAVVAPAEDAHGAAFLLPTAHLVGKIIADGHVVKLRRWLVVPRAPGLAAVNGDDGALVADQQNDVGIVRADPEVLVIVAAGRAAQAGPALAAVTGTQRDNACAVDHIWIFGINPWYGQIAAANAHGGARVLGDFVPALAGIVGTVKAEPGRRFVITRLRG